MSKSKLLGTYVAPTSKVNILEKIKKNTFSRAEYIHIVSLNPEICMLAQHDEEFRKVIETAQIQIVDGVGVRAAGYVLGISMPERVSGVDLMATLMDLAGRKRLTVVLIGGSKKIAEKLADCYQRQFPDGHFFGLEGFSDVRNPTKKETEAVFSIVRDRRPHFVFAAFGSPEQEKWLWRNRALLEGCVCMGVGGGFDFLSGAVPRAPAALRTVGLEWLYRLLRQPWRWRRQLRLFQFIGAVMRQYIVQPHS